MMRAVHYELKRLVDARCEDLGISQNQVAKELGADSGNFSRLLREGGEVGLKLGLRIEEVLGLPARSWFEEAKDGAA